MTDLQWSAGDAWIQTSEDDRTEVCTRSDVVLSKHVVTVDVELAAFLCVLVN